MANNRPFSLRREIGFYGFLSVVLIAISAFVVIVSLVKGVPLPWIGLVTVLVFLGFAAAISLAYRIEWDGGHVVQKAFLSKMVKISPSEIISIDKEKSGFAEAAQMRRPFQRITLYGSDLKGQSSRIDISTKGFNGGDVKKLLEIIASLRPDLSVPEL